MISKLKKSFLIASARSSCLEFFFWFSSEIFLYKMKSLFFSLFQLFFAKFFMSFWKAEDNFPSNFASIFSAITYNSSISFLAQTLYTLVKRNPLRCKFWRDLSAQVKIHQVVVSILKWQVKSSSNFASFSNVKIHISSGNFNLTHFLLRRKGSH